jgi:hypothetical protein
VIAIFRNRSSAQIGDVMDEQAREIFQRAFAAIQRVNCIEHDMREREQHRLLTGDPDEWKVTAERQFSERPATRSNHRSLNTVKSNASQPMRPRSRSFNYQFASAFPIFHKDSGTVLVFCARVSR